MFDPGSTSITELTFEQIVAYLYNSRCPNGLVVGGLVSDDDNCVETTLITCGNRAACVGMADALVDQSRKRLVEAMSFKDLDGGEVKGEDDDG